jgi:glycosyltransferase involved in cell wall biosynthesis
MGSSLTWLAKFDDHASMGILSQRVIEKLSVDVSCKPIIGKTETNNQLILDYIEKPINTDLGIMFAYPDMFPVLNGYKTKVIYTGVDSTGGIPNFAQNSNNADFLLTPSNKSKERMEKLGVTKPIFVFPHGVDPEIFKYTERVKSDKFKFLYVGECSDRKGIFQLLDTFISEFKGNKNVELHIKSNNDMRFYNGDKVTEIVNSHSNIFWHSDNRGHEFVLELYKTCHAYVYPSRADTFGMTLLEAMACGLPVISTDEPGATELIEGRYYQVRTKNVPVKDHPWMLGEWGEPNVGDLRKHMRNVYENYDIISLKENSDYIRENYTWEMVTKRFEKEILPKLKKDYKILTLLTSYNRPHHIKNIINSIKEIREYGVVNDVYIVENSNTEVKGECVKVINENIDDRFKLYVSEFNMGQRGALLQMLEDVNIDDYDFIQFTDQDNIFNEPLNTYCEILNENQDIFFTTGYMSKEHGELGWRKTKFGNLCEKRSIRAGHMFMRVRDLKSLFPIHLDSQYGEPHNSSWNAGLDWELQYWNPKSFGRRTNNNFILCLPGGVLHKGVDSTMYDWPVEENEYPLDELNKLRYS